VLTQCGWVTATKALREIGFTLNISGGRETNGIVGLPPALGAPHGVLSDVAGGTLRGPPA
jgi:hypothetical protein